MNRVTSNDGTTIAYERAGSGRPLILVDGALCSRAFGPMPKLAPLLAEQFTVFMYDRRGRGESGDTQPYAREREVEDIAALIEAAGGGPVNLLGLSSGAALALEAAASGLNIAKVAAYEAPFMVDDGGHHAAADHEGRLKALIEEDRRGDAVKYFMRDMVGIPAIFVLMMRLMPGMWRKLQAVAHTLPYDAAIMNRFTVPTARFASIRVPTLIIGGAKSEARLQSAVRAVAEAVPGAGQRFLAGQTHNVDPKVLAPAVKEFFSASRTEAAQPDGLASAR
jgi:pimeloyl-ACP methyl ester carboxylesterase